MIETAVLVPAGILIFWTMVVMIIMTVSRAKTFSGMKIDLAKSPPGARGADIEKQYPEVRDWAAHNYMHLMEQPTIFYAASVLLAIGGFTGYDVALCWLYVLIRIGHSVWQIWVNTIPIRMALFGASSAVMLLISVRAMLSVL